MLLTGGRGIQGNHDDDPHVEFRLKGEYVVGTVVKRIPVRSEIYQSYGEVGSADLLYRYGFTREGPQADDPRPQDVVSIDTEILSCLASLSASELEQRVAFLHQCSILEESPWDGLEDHLTIQLAPMHEHTKHIPQLPALQAHAATALRDTAKEQVRALTLLVYEALRY